MDQGWAGIVGAAVGVVGTAGASAVSYAVARWQALEQGKIGHSKELRNDRRDAYVAFLEVAQPVDRVLHRLTEELVLGGDAPTGADSAGLILDELGTAERDLHKVQARLDLLGPKSVADQAVRWWSDLRELRTLLGALPQREALDSRHRASLQRAIDAVELGRERFVDRARGVLEASP